MRVGNPTDASQKPAQPKIDLGPCLMPGEKEKFQGCPQGIKKVSLLGKGGIGVVWLAVITDAR